MSAEAPATAPSGVLRRLLDTVLRIAQTRLELLGTEVEQEKLRIGRALLLGAAACVVLTVALLLLSAALVLALDAAWRVPALAALGVAYVLAGGWLLQRAQAALAAPVGGSFALSVGELRKDRETLRPPTP